MSADDDDRISLWVGELKDGSKKLYLVKGDPAVNNIRGWQEIKPRKILGGRNDSKEKIRAAAITQARLRFDSADDLSNTDKTYPTWDGNKQRRLDTGFPKFRFPVEPWQSDPAQATEALVDKSTQQSNVDTSYSFAKYLATLRPEQRAFRQAVLSRYRTKCAFCSITLEDLLHASHLREFAVDPTSNTADNGIPLCLNHHGAFDAHYITVDPESLAVTVHHKMIETTVEVRSLAGYLWETAKPYLRLRIADSETRKRAPR